MTGDNPFMNWDIPISNQRIYKYAMIYGGGTVDGESYANISYFKTLKSGIKNFSEIWENYEHRMDYWGEELEIYENISGQVDIDGLTITNPSDNSVVRLPSKQLNQLISDLLTIKVNEGDFDEDTDFAEIWNIHMLKWNRGIENLNLDEYERKLDKAYDAMNKMKSHEKRLTGWLGLMELNHSDDYNSSCWRLVRLP